MNLSPHHVHIRELTALGLPGGSGSGDDDNPDQRKPKKKSRSPIEKPLSSSEEERLVKSSDEEKSESYGTFDPKSKSTPKKKKADVKPVRSTRQPTEMEGCAIHGLDVFSNEGKASQLRKLSPPVIVQTRKFPPESPPEAGTFKSSPETSKDYLLTGAIPKKRVQSDKSTSKQEQKQKGSKSAPIPRTKDSKVQKSDVKHETITDKPEEKSKDSKLKSTYRSPRKAIQKCLSLLTSPPKKDSKEQRPRTRSQSKKAKAEDQKKIATEQVSKPKTETEQPKQKKKVRERSTSKTRHLTRPVERMSLISSMDKSSESDSSPQCSPRKSRKRHDPLVASLIGKPLEKVCSIVSKSDSDSCLVMELDPSGDLDHSTGDKLLTPLAKLSTEPDKDENSDDNIEEKSGSDSSGE